MNNRPVRMMLLLLLLCGVAVLALWGMSELKGSYSTVCYWETPDGEVRTWRDRSDHCVGCHVWRDAALELISDDGTEYACTDCTITLKERQCWYQDEEKRWLRDDER